MFLGMGPFELILIVVVVLVLKSTVIQRGESRLRHAPIRVRKRFIARSESHERGHKLAIYVPSPLHRQPSLTVAKKCVAIKSYSADSPLGSVDGSTDTTGVMGG